MNTLKYILVELIHFYGIYIYKICVMKCNDHTPFYFVHLDNETL